MLKCVAWRAAVCRKSGKYAARPRRSGAGWRVLGAALFWGFRTLRGASGALPLHPTAFEKAGETFFALRVLL